MQPIGTINKIDDIITKSLNQQALHGPSKKYKTGFHTNMSIVIIGKTIATTTKSLEISQ